MPFQILFWLILFRLTRVNLFFFFILLFIFRRFGSIEIRNDFSWGKLWKFDHVSLRSISSELVFNFKLKLILTSCCSISFLFPLSSWELILFISRHFIASCKGICLYNITWITSSALIIQVIEIKEFEGVIFVKGYSGVPLGTWHLMVFFTINMLLSIFLEHIFICNHIWNFLDFLYFKALIKICLLFFRNCKLIIDFSKINKHLSCPNLKLNSLVLVAQIFIFLHCLSNLNHGLA